MAPATPPHSRLTCVFITRTSGLSRDGFPRSSGKWVSPKLFSVPNVKKENPGGNNTVHMTHILCKLDKIGKDIHADLLKGSVVKGVIDKNTVACHLCV